MFRQTLFLQIPPELFSEPGFLNPSGDFIFATISAVVGYGLIKGKDRLWAETRCCDWPHKPRRAASQ